MYSCAVYKNGLLFQDLADFYEGKKTDSLLSEHLSGTLLAVHYRDHEVRPGTARAPAGRRAPIP